MPNSSITHATCANPYPRCCPRCGKYWPAEADWRGECEGLASPEYRQVRETHREEWVGGRLQRRGGTTTHTIEVALYQHKGCGGIVCDNGYERSVDFESCSSIAGLAQEP